MAANMMLSLDTLPVEILHRIFDSLDTETILFSVKYVCKRFNLITINYNRYKLNFKTIFKHTFHQLCRITYPENIISLTLSNENQTPGQIELFLSLYRIEEYTRLQSVTLMAIEEYYLNIILKHLSTTCLLISLVIQYELNSILSTETLLLLSLIIGKTSLRKLDLNLGYTILDKFKWPLDCSVQYLRLPNRIRFDTFCMILRCLRSIKTMILRDCIINDIEEMNYLISDNTLYRQLTSLTFEDCDLKMTLIESILSLTPSLIHLTIIGNSDDLFDGARWEKFIQTKLPDLNKFQFAFQSNINISHDPIGLEALLISFQTSFWLETKQWLVTALCVQSSQFINLFTTQDCVSKINFHPKANKIARSTASKVIEDKLTMDSVREMSLDLMEMQVDIIEKKEISNHCLFNRLTRLTLQLHEDWPNGSLRLLSSFIDLSTITELVLDINFTQSDSCNTTTCIIALLEQTSSIRSLIILNRHVSLQTICSIVSNRVKNLQIPVNTVEETKMILKRFNHLFSVTFKFLGNSLSSIAEIIEWLVSKGRDFTYQSTQCSLNLWLGTSKELFLN
ncbi:unnamed protein product [Rotaria sp. Silwood2]|nr:unnamed protein product [Rotaria sp. Silwood2]CAF4118445.1 unnamed protein product [Rotaria sp. Silwood2]